VLPQQLWAGSADDGAENEGDDDRVVERFRAERSGEYEEIVSRVPAFLEEIAYERQRGRASYAEVEEMKIGREVVVNEGRRFWDKIAFLVFRCEN
jgi:hypothetical protein